MKFDARRFGAFLKSPDPELRAALIYGPDQGQVRERAEQMSRAIVPDLKDPFRVTTLSWGDVAADPARLADEAAQMAFGGGRRLVRVRPPGTADARYLEALFQAPSLNALVVLEAGDLAKSSALRRRFEEKDGIAAIACYADEETGILSLIKDVLGQAQLQLEQAAEDYLLRNLGNDRGVSRRELEKLVLYMGRSGPLVTLADVQACIGDHAGFDIDDVVDAAAEGQLNALDLALRRAFGAGETAVSLLRRTMSHFQRLHLAHGFMTVGATPEAAMAKLKPPIFFKRQATVRGQLRRWSGPTLERALDILLTAEMAVKSTGAPDQALCRQALMRIAAAVRR